MPAKPAVASIAAAAGRRMRRAGTAMRAFRPSPVITLTLALVLGGAGGAGAATGGNFILGKANSETSTATLSNPKGTPLKLVAPFGTPPLRVNKTDAEIPNLDAQFAGGFTGDQMVNIGGDGLAKNSPIGFDAKMIASTGPLPAGIYYVSASAQLFINTGGGGTGPTSFCRISTGSSPGSAFGFGAVDQPSGNVQIAMTTAVAITLNDTIQEWCATDVGVGGTAVQAGITAIRMAFSEGDPPARANSPLKQTLPGHGRGTSGSRRHPAVDLSERH